MRLVSSRRVAPKKIPDALKAQYFKIPRAVSDCHFFKNEASPPVAETRKIFCVRIFTNLTLLLFDTPSLVFQKNSSLLKGR